MENTKIRAPVTLKGGNYLLWARTMKTILCGRGFWPHIIKSEAPRETTTNEEGLEIVLVDEDKWFQEDQMVLSVLQNSLEASILEGYSYCETPKDLWETLQNVFGNQSNLSRVFEIKKAINELTQGDMEFTQHFGKFRSLWAELEMLRPNTLDPAVINERREQDKVFGLLFTLSPAYNDRIKHLLRADKLQNLEEVCSQIQKEQGSLGLFGSKGELVSGNSSELASANRGNFNANRGKAPWCDHCKRSGHAKEKCWILHPHLKPARREPRANQATGGNLGGQEQAGTSSQALGGNGAAMMASSDLVRRSDLDALIKALKESSGNAYHALSSLKPLIVDSGASHHMISDSKLMKNIEPALGNVIIANGDKIPVKGLGDLELFSKKSKAFYMPTFTSNLLSVKKATTDLNCYAIFGPNDVHFQDIETSRVLGHGGTKDGLYVLEDTKLSTPLASHFSSVLVYANNAIWHARLGHPHSRALGLLLPSISFKNDECEACILGKHCKSVFPKSNTIYENCFDLVHSDVWTSPCLSRENQKYFVTFIDEKSKYTWLTLLPSKDRVLEAFTNFQNYVTNHYNAKIKIFRSDNGGEYTSHTFKQHLAKHGIIHQTSCPYTPQQNGVAERKNRHLMEFPYKYGYSITQKGYKCYIPETRKVLVSRDVKFVESKGYYEEKNWEDIQDLTNSPSDRASNLRIILERLGVSNSQSHTNSPNSNPEPTQQQETSQHEEEEHLQEEENIQENIQENSLEEGEIPSDHEEETTLSEEENLPTSDHNEESTSQEAPIALRRSQRQKFPPSNWKNTRVYYNSQAVAHPIQAVCTIAHFPEEHQVFLGQIDQHWIPQTYEEAIEHQVWRDAIAAERQAMEHNHTWEEGELPKGKKAVTSKWVFTIKYKSNGDIERYKARLVARGFTQTYGEDYRDTFAPVAKLHTVRVVLSLATNLEWELWQMDVKNAFLQGELEEEVYMKPPPGLEDHNAPGKVFKLKKAIYGLKQSPRAWYHKLSTTLLDRGFKKSEADNTLFTLPSKEGIVVILVYVDDIIISGNDKVGIQETKAFLKSVFDIKDLGELKYFLGIEVCRSKEGLFLSQRKYTLDLLSQVGKLGAKPAKTPLEDDYKANRKGELDNKPFEDVTQYRRLVGKLIYLTITRPDICFAVNVVSQHMQAPTLHHWNMVTRILKYLKGAPGQGIWMGCNKNTELVGYCDADYAGDTKDRRSTTGYCTFIGGNLVTWRSKKQKVVSLSSAEAEYRAMRKLTTELMWLKALLKDFGIDTPKPITMHCDNQAAIHIASNSVFHERTKHIEVDCHKVREQVQLGVILPCYTESEEQLADIFTKGASTKVFLSHAVFYTKVFNEVVEFGSKLNLDTSMFLYPIDVILESTKDMECRYELEPVEQHEARNQLEPKEQHEPEDELVAADVLLKKLIKPPWIGERAMSIEFNNGRVTQLYSFSLVEFCPNGFSQQGNPVPPLVRHIQRRTSGISEAFRNLCVTFRFTSSSFNLLEWTTRVDHSNTIQDHRPSTIRSTDSLHSTISDPYSSRLLEQNPIRPSETPTRASLNSLDLRYSTVQLPTRSHTRLIQGYSIHSTSFRVKDSREFVLSGTMVSRDEETNSNNNKLLMEAVTKLMDTKLNAFCAELHQMSRSPRRSQEQREQIPHPKDGKPRRPDEKPNWRRRSPNQDYYHYDDQRRFEKARQQHHDLKEEKAVRQRPKKAPKEQKDTVKSNLIAEESFKEELLEILNAYDKPKQTKHLQDKLQRQRRIEELEEEMLETLNAFTNGQKKSPTNRHPICTEETNKRPSCPEEELAIQEPESNQPLPICKEPEVLQEKAESNTKQNVETQLHTSAQDQQSLTNKEEQPKNETVNHLIASRESLEAKFDFCIIQSSHVAENNYACEKLTQLEPVHPSSIVSCSQILEDSSREEQRSLSLAKDMEQPPDFVPEPVLMHIPSYYSRKHCKDIELVRIEPNLFVLVSAEEEKRFCLERVKEFRVSDSVLSSMLTSFERLTPETFLKPKCLSIDQWHEIHFSLNISKFSSITKLIGARSEPRMSRTFSTVKRPLETALFASESLYESSYHLEFESKVLGYENLLKHHQKELFDPSRTFDVFPLVFVKDHEKQVKDAISNTRRSDAFANPFDCGSKEHMDQAWSQMKESRERKARTYLFGVWNWKYLRKTTAIAKGCSTLKYYFANVYFCSILFFVSTLFPFDVGDLDLRSNPFQAKGDDMIKHEQGAEEELENELDHTPFKSIELGTTHRINLEMELELGPDEALIIQTSLMTWSRANKMIFEVGERLMCSIQIKENPPDALPEQRSIPKVSAYVLKNAFNPDHTDMIRLSLSKEPNVGFKAALDHMRSTERREEDNRFKPPDLDQDQHQDINSFILINEGPPNEIFKSKLKPTMHRPFKAFRLIQNQDYPIDLQGKQNLSSSFEVSDLVLSNAEKSDLRSNPFQVGEDDVILESTKDMECRYELEPVEQHEARNQLEPKEQHEPEDELVAADVLLKKLIKPPWIGERAMSIEFNNGRVTQLYSFSLVEFCPNGFSQQGNPVPPLVRHIQRRTSGISEAFRNLCVTFRFTSSSFNLLEWTTRVDHSNTIQDHRPSTIRSTDSLHSTISDPYSSRLLEQNPIRPSETPTRASLNSLDLRYSTVQLPTRSHTRLIQGYSIHSTSFRVKDSREFEEPHNLGAKLRIELERKEVVQDHPRPDSTSWLDDTSSRTPGSRLGADSTRRTRRHVELDVKAPPLKITPTRRGRLDVTSSWSPPTLYFVL
ncbi:Ribonuclease H-like superfamily [Arabidopsis suecica]|uniref:Ribonuclease H-like superfamily n=1 Tax=Arabidopsis suecica TaxID=45249 RepID=A0A8T2AG31_ARASU|nr:Ribonuclease H-like superfamily [Arabidopsis suecica]